MVVPDEEDRGEVLPHQDILPEADLEAVERDAAALRHLHRLGQAVELRLTVRLSAGVGGPGRDGPRCCQMRMPRGSGSNAGVYPPGELAQVPLGVHERQVGERDVRPDALDLLGVPEREGVVVARGDQDAVRLHRLEDVVGEVARHASRGRGWR